MANTGLDLNKEIDNQLDSDWIFGAASSPCLAIIPSDLRVAYLPDGELQFGVEDLMDCVTRAYLNVLEAKFNWLYANNELKNRKWLEDNGYVYGGRITFSDRFIAIKSGTSRSGNSLKEPADTIHRYGLIPKQMFPKSPGTTFDQYHDPSKITQEMEALGREFAARFSINYERVLEADFKKASEDDFIVCGLYAWPPIVEGEYPRIDNTPNHSVAVIRPEYFIFDNYIDDDYIKKLSPNYDFWQYGYRIFISRETTPEDAQKTINLLTILADLLRQYLSLLNKRLGAWFGSL